MMGYTFSRREKALLVVLALLAVAGIWYQFVFVGTQDTISRLNAQIADVQDQKATDAARVMQTKRMSEEIERCKAAGIAPAEIPAYDNVQALMARLNGTLAPTTGYNLKFEDVAAGSAGIVTRGVELSYGCGSYQEARVILNSLTRGGFPCSIDDFTLTDNGAKVSASTATRNVGSGSANAAPYSASAHLTFYEKGTLPDSGSGSGSSSSTSSATGLAEGMGMVSPNSTTKS